MSSPSQHQHVTNGRQRAKHQAAYNSSSTDSAQSTSIETENEATLLSLIPSPISSLLPSLLSAPLSSLTFSSFQNHIITSGYIPDSVLRPVSRYLMKQRYDECHSLSVDALAAYKAGFVNQLRSLPHIAEQTEAANQQHYEVPSPFYEAVLGARLKYSCCYYPTMREQLNEAEDAMLALYIQRAQLEPGQRILDLGCGWGSFTLYAAKRLPASHFTALSNSHSQRQFIQAKAKAMGLSNVTVITCDINALTPAVLSNVTFDRIVSIEMFEHMKQYDKLMALCASLLTPRTGLLFVHIFVHRFYPYHFTADSGWMAQYFFSGGTMPSADLLHFFNQSNLTLHTEWAVSGLHYARTSRQWLERLDARWPAVVALMRTVYERQVEGVTGSGISGVGMARMWRVFFIAVEELFAWNKGQEWYVMHYLFRRTD